jgi:hypothetical protein
MHEVCLSFQKDPFIYGSTWAALTHVCWIINLFWNFHFWQIEYSWKFNNSLLFRKKKSKNFNIFENNIINVDAANVVGYVEIIYLRLKFGENTLVRKIIKWNLPPRIDKQGTLKSFLVYFPRHLISPIFLYFFVTH